MSIVTDVALNVLQRSKDEPPPDIIGGLAVKYSITGRLAVGSPETWTRAVVE